MEEIKLENIMQHYTTISAMFNILENGLNFAFGDGKSWIDKNDLHSLQKYKRYIGKKVYVLCFCDGMGNAHHWTTLGKVKKKDLESKIKCSIVLDKQQFIHQMQALNCISRRMIYCSNGEVLSYDIRDILFLKRNEYENEHEFRFVYICNDGEMPISINIKSFIRKIVIGNCEKQKYEEIKHRLMTEFLFTEDQIGQNLLNDSVEWDKNIDTLIKQVPTTNNNTSKSDIF